RLENNKDLIFTYTDGTEETINLDFSIYTIQFKTPEGNVFDVQTLKEGASITYPEAPEIEGHTFTGFESEPTEATEDKVIEALYDPLSITLTFDTLNGNTFTRTKDYGTSIDFPDPTRDGYEFMGWFEDTAFNTPFASSTMPEEDMTLYAKWIDLSTGETVSDSTDTVSMLENIERSIVGVNNTISDTEGGTGSGVVYKDNGDGSFNMITNQHVIENYESLEIVYEYLNNYYIVPDSNVTVLGSYAETDIAVIEFTPTHSVDTISIADSYDVSTGERVYALGSPQGQNYVGSVTEGIVASPMRYMSSEGTDALFIQHDAAISPGNSGGALVNAQGQLIGMNTLKLTGENVEGMGFAVTSNTITRMIEDIEDDGTVTRATLGVSMSDTTQCSADYGACIDSVTVGSTADDLGLESGDSITGYKTASMTDFREIYNQNYLYESVLNTLVGTEITVEYERDGTNYTSDPVIID
ncbi:MAG: trypsin-like peptidase domain-containing protein, partial [Bacillota bacterium]